MYDEKKHLKENDSVLIEFEHIICFSKIQVDLHSSQIEYCSRGLHKPSAYSEWPAFYLLPSSPSQ